MPAVMSSAVDKVGYDAQSRALTIWFRGGRRYRYSNVPPSIYRELLKAESIGAYVNRRIKPRYPYSRE